MPDPLLCRPGTDTLSPISGTSTHNLKKIASVCGVPSCSRIELLIGREQLVIGQRDLLLDKIIWFLDRFFNECEYNIKISFSIPWYQKLSLIGYPSINI